MKLPTLEEQVCLKSQSIKLRELGVELKSLFIFGEHTGHITIRSIYDKSKSIPAYTVAELGVLLPYQFTEDGMKCEIKCDNLSEKYFIHFYKDGNHIEAFISRNEAEVRAEALIYLLNEKIIKVEDLAA